MSTEVGAPYGTVQPKRSEDKVPVSMDWHDYLINLWQPGLLYTVNQVIRPRRSAATGFQHRCTTGGVTGKTEPRWPKQPGVDVEDGSVTWVSELITGDSLRTFVSTAHWESDAGVTRSNETSGDLIYTTMVDGGEHGKDYKLTHLVELANGEEKEGAVIVPVRDQPTQQ